MQLVVIPPFIVYDGFGGDVASEEIYERILNLTDQTPTWVTHAKSFLRACVVRHNAPDPKQHVDMVTFTAMRLWEAKIWAKKKFETIYPQQQQTPSAQPQPQQQHTPDIMQNMWFQQMF
eukprot:2827872-Ditylum_brightwellii.AAC.1